MAKMAGETECFIFGGGQIFQEVLGKNLVDELYLTIVDGDYNADTFFPEYPEFAPQNLQGGKRRRGVQV